MFEQIAILARRKKINEVTFFSTHVFLELYGFKPHLINVFHSLFDYNCS